MRNPKDEYEWWDLEAGQYLIEYNERISGDTSVRLQTRGAVLERGAFHPTITVNELHRVPFAVGVKGLPVKEKARLTTAAIV